jgi:acyl-CoA reductase-like NAD-dependent aldehyde dehydrogenase
MAYFNFGRFDTEEEAIAIANATDVGLAGRCLSLFNNSQSFSQANVRLCLLNINLAFEKETSTECFVTFCHLPSGKGRFIQLHVFCLVSNNTH